MPEQSGLQETPHDAELPMASNPLPAPPAQTARNNNIRVVMILCCLGIVTCFFLPWVQMLFTRLSGYQLQQLPSDEVKFLLLIPITSAVALVGAVTGKSMVITGQVAGAMPFIALMYYSAKIGQGLFQALQIGAYLTLFCAAILCVVPHFLLKPKS